MIHLRHRWYLIQIREMGEKPYDCPEAPYSPYTLVLYLCTAPECRKHKVERLNGRWTLEELKEAKDERARL